MTASDISQHHILVTGASGFVGGHLARKLLSLGAKVNLLLRNTNSKTARELENLGATLIQGDVKKIDTLLLASQDCDIVMHVAALFREAKHPDSEYFEVNVRGTANVLEAAKDNRVRRVVYCSTNGVHGGYYSKPIDETYKFEPGDVYQVSKCESEELIQKFIKDNSTPEVVILRPGMIWGEGDSRFKKMFSGVSKGTLPIIGTGKTWTHWLYVHDLVDAFISAALVPGINGEAFLIAGDRPVTLQYVYKTIASLAGAKVFPLRIPALPVQIAGSICETICSPLGIEPPLFRRRVDFFVKNRCFDTSKAKRLLNFHPKQTFEDETRNIFEWYKESGWL